MSEKPRTSVPKDVANRSISESAQALKARKRKADASPPVSEWQREFPGKVKVDERTGDFSLNLTERDDIRKAVQMQEGSRKLEIERGAELQAEMQKEKVVRRDGRVIDFPEDMVDSVKHRFKGGVGRNGMATPLRFSMSGLTDVPKWSRMCSVCGAPQGLWRQWTKPVCVDGFTCDECGSENDWFWESDREE